MIVAEVVERIREYLRAELMIYNAPGPETMVTRADARPGRGLAIQGFSDEDLILRIDKAQHEIMATCDACLFPIAIDDINIITSGIEVGIPNSIHRVLENRIFRSGVRCLVVDADDSSPRASHAVRHATSDKPVASISGGTIRMWPNALNNLIGVVMVSPPLYNTTDALWLPRLFEEAMVQLVLESIRVTQLQEGTDGELYGALAEYHRKLYIDEIAPHSVNARYSRRFIDSESTVEARSK